MPGLMLFKDKQHTGGPANTSLPSEALLFQVQVVIQYGLWNQFSEQDKLFKKIK